MTIIHRQRFELIKELLIQRVTKRENVLVYPKPGLGNKILSLVKKDNTTREKYENILQNIKMLDAKDENVVFAIVALFVDIMNLILRNPNLNDDDFSNHNRRFIKMFQEILKTAPMEDVAQEKEMYEQKMGISLLSIKNDAFNKWIMKRLVNLLDAVIKDIKIEYNQESDLFKYNQGRANIVSSVVIDSSFKKIMPYLEAPDYAIPKLIENSIYGIAMLSPV
ncbi:MAG: hypothetical protein HKM04_01005 [Legionellales bacterium]|nr:hypothetical protein [Legionellales bacterium]